MKQKMMSLLLGLMVVVTMFGARPVFAQGETPIDISMDRNGNQISDAVESEVATLKAIPADQRSAEIKSFVSKLPYSPETVALQQRALELSTSLQMAKPEEGQAIYDELLNVSGQLDEDPVIKKVGSDILTLTGYGMKDNGSDPSLSKVNFGSLRKGDILARKSVFGGVFPWMMKYEHTGNFDANGKVYESNLLDGVNLHPLEEWTRCCQYVGHARQKSSVTASAIAAAVEFAKARWGFNGRTPYNLLDFPNKIREDRMYCSQLTWKINKRVGLDLDSNDWGYKWFIAAKYTPAVWLITDPAVAPDEVMLSPHLVMQGEGYQW